jgi:hypothetical protein
MKTTVYQFGACKHILSALHLLPFSPKVKLYRGNAGDWFVARGGTDVWQ